MKSGTQVNINDSSILQSLVHDRICKKWTFDYTDNRLDLQLLRQSSETESIILRFNDVFIHNMVSCDYWGASPHVHTIEFKKQEESPLYTHIMDDIYNGGNSSERINENTVCIEAKVIFTSGNVLSILCRDILMERTCESGKDF